MARIEVYRSKSLLRAERWRWRLVADNGAVIATGGEGYANRLECVAMATAIVSGTYASAPVV